jgi:4-aminobutyrate aminotransferase-like enzyme
MADDGRQEDLAKAEVEGAVPRIAVRPPGPRSYELLARQRRVAWSGAVDTMPIAIRRKHRSVIEDVDGNLLIDMLTG